MRPIPAAGSLGAVLQLHAIGTEEIQPGVSKNLLGQCCPPEIYIAIFTMSDIIRRYVDAVKEKHTADECKSLSTMSLMMCTLMQVDMSKTEGHVDQHVAKREAQYGQG